MRTLAICLIAVLAIPFAVTTQSPGPNPVNLWVVDLKWTGNQLSVGTPMKLESAVASQWQVVRTDTGISSTNH